MKIDWKDLKEKVIVAIFVIIFFGFILGIFGLIIYGEYQECQQQKEDGVIDSCWDMGGDTKCVFYCEKKNYTYYSIGMNSCWCEDKDNLVRIW